jgi:hypothetical protein
MKTRDAIFWFGIVLTAGSFLLIIADNNGLGILSAILAAMCAFYLIEEQP